MRVFIRLPLRIGRSSLDGRWEPALRGLGAVELEESTADAVFGFDVELGVVPDDSE